MNEVEIFEDTIDYSIQNGLTNSVTRLHTFADIEPCVAESIKPLVLNSDTVSAAVTYSKLGKTAVLNMASFKRPGGGVARGAKAQEESLFRCSNLSQVIDNIYYPLSKDHCLYTKDAVFFKDFNYHYMKEIVVDVITMPAINLNGFDISTKKSYEEYEILTLNKIRLIFSVASKNSVKNLILGAWGCGVFDNDPKLMAGFFKKILDEGYGHSFDNVVFAIINDHNSVDDNFTCFKQIL